MDLYNCATCSPAARRSLGHDGPPTQWWRDNLLTGEPLAECPLRSILRAHEATPALAREVDRAIARDHPDYQNGILPALGGADDQPARRMELIRMVERVHRETESRYLELLEQREGEGD